MPITLTTNPTRRAVVCLAAGAAGSLALTPLAAWAQGAPSGQKLKIATIGAGREGGALGALFVKEGHSVMFSSRHPEQLKDFVTGLGPLARAGTVAEAVAFGDVVLLADLRHRGVRHDQQHDIARSEEHTSELQSHLNLVFRLLL